MSKHFKFTDQLIVNIDHIVSIKRITNRILSITMKDNILPESVCFKNSIEAIECMDRFVKFVGGNHE